LGSCSTLPVFASPEGGPLRVNNFGTRYFDQVAVRAGLLGLTPHKLRLPAASLAVSAGANVEAVQRPAPRPCLCVHDARRVLGLT